MLEVRTGGRLLRRTGCLEEEFSPLKLLVFDLPQVCSKAYSSILIIYVLTFTQSRHEEDHFLSMECQLPLYRNERICFAAGKADAESPLARGVLELLGIIENNDGERGHCPLRAPARQGYIWQSKCPVEHRGTFNQQIKISHRAHQSFCCINVHDGGHELGKSALSITTPPYYVLIKI